MGEAKRRSAQFRKPVPPCVFCAERPGTTRDHVPAKNLFVSPRPQLITVPACDTCNGSMSELEEQFRVYIGAKMGIDTAASAAFWRQGGFRSVINNRRLLRELLSGAPLWIRSSNTGEFEPSRTYRWPRNIHDRVIAKITRGLYYHHFREVLSPGTTVEVSFLNRLPEEILELAMGDNFIRRNLGGDDRFCYAYGRTENREISIWIFQFYKRHWAAAITNPETLTTGMAMGESCPTDAGEPVDSSPVSTS